jgi:thiamine pyrophosphokinase
VKAIICAAGQVSNYQRVRSWVGAADLVLCADGGVQHALALGLTPSAIIGDLDSADRALVAALAAQGVPVQQVPVEKDQTDTHLVLAEAIRRGATDIWLVGATGSRLDHTLGNLLLLPGVPPHVRVTVVDGSHVIRLLRPGGRLTVTGTPGDLLSLLPLSPEVRGVVVEGVKWPLVGATLRWGESLGISNVLVEPEAFVAIREGYLLVVQAWE